MLLIGESLNVISIKIGRAFRARDPKPIQEEALFQKEKGMDFIDINLGPAKKDGHELMPWVVETVQEVVDDVPLVLDTSNIDAIEAALKICKLPPLINSIMVRPERYERMVPLAAEHNAHFIALMWGPDGLPRDENERASLCVELLYFANEAGVPNENIWVDGIVTPVNIQQPQLMSLMAFQGMVEDIAPGAKSTCGLSNISNGPPEHLRPILNQTFMVMLQRHGMCSVIADPLDEKLADIARGNRQDIVDLIYSVMDGNAPDMDSLSKEMQDYAKTVNVILGNTLYSDSWLDI
ncbi:MAG: dihydropteroate synthase [Desulfobacterales bacterium]|jgi:5-methyltetrahydrofolate corrinoid/iron sulfur protein methyltransferase|nr:dihydropteroate synthase [Desulfobacter sp.]MDP6394907.1 dihydropteroate synthase [Desulfobacterales bacterium]MDP6682413.1 dihydropteroate synthase [Desulfobacterales bacterium]MDP6807164.1 dihydropteroate synthase [Desulfobacterales bacterium]|tara:strand:- start:1505 stop:2386 length:882 start_codon:yes stop_codon:yes gene_type:complete